MSSPRELLKALRSELVEIPDPSDWSRIEAWAAHTRPLFRKHFADYLPDLENATKEPQWLMPIYVASTNPRTGRRTDNSRQADSLARTTNAHIGETLRRRILACIDGILAVEELAPPSDPPAPEPTTEPASAQPATHHAQPDERLRDWFVGIDGSAADGADRPRLARCHQAIRALVRGILNAGGGVVTLVSGDPRIVEDDPDTANTFIWTVLSEVDRFLHTSANLNAQRRPLVRTVWSPRTITDRIPPRQQALWERLIASGRVEVRVLQDAGHFGVKLREAQADLGHALVILGGGKGVRHLASLYQDQGKPVVALDPMIGSSKNDGEGALALHRESLSEPAKFAPDAAHDLQTTLASLSLQRDDAAPEGVANRLVSLLGTILRAAASRLSASRKPPVRIKVTVSPAQGFDHEALAQRIGRQLSANACVAGMASDAVEVEVTGVSKDAVIGAAENGLLDQCASKTGGGQVKEIWSSGECLYEALDEVEFKRPSIKDVGTEAVVKALTVVDVLLVTVTETERKALLDRLSPLPKYNAVFCGPYGSQTLRFGRLGRYAVAHVESAMGSGGRSGATLTVNDAIQVIKPKAIIAVGIAFGADRRKQRLGDVLIAETIAPYELAKVHEAGSTLRGQPLSCGITLRDRFLSGKEGWVHPATGRQVQVHPGIVLSGEKVIDRQEFRDSLLAHYPTAIGGEMEGSGVYAAADRRGIREVILVKAICDFADGHKNDRGQPFAARAAVAYVERVLARPDALGHLGARDWGLPRARRG